MNFQTMEYFRAIAREGSFTRAAERLHVTQQTLSAHIAGVERELGCALLERSSPLRLTHEGETFLAYAERFETELTGLRRSLSGADEHQEGVLRIGVAFTRGRVVLPPIVERFRERYPNVTVEIAEDGNEGILEALANGKIDLVIGVMARPMAGFETEGFYREQTVLLASKELLAKSGLRPEDLVGPLSRSDLRPLRGCPLIMNPPEDITGNLGLELVSCAGFKPNVSASSRNMETLLALALRGVGACICPKNLLDATATPEQKQGLLAFDLGPKASYEISFCVPAAATRWHVIDEFVRLAKESLA